MMLLMIVMAMAVLSVAMQADEVTKVLRSVGRKDLVAAEGWLEIQPDSTCGGVAVIHFQVQSIAVLRRHVVRITKDLGKEEAKLEVRVDLVQHTTSATDPTSMAHLLLLLLLLCFAASGSLMVLPTTSLPPLPFPFAHVLLEPLVYLCIMCCLSYVSTAGGSEHNEIKQ